MKKLLALLFLAGVAHAGTITTSFAPLGTITFSSGTAAAGGGSPLAFVQATSTASTDGGCGSVLNTITVAAGDLLVLGCATTANFSGITPTDASDSWLTAGSSITGSNFIGIWYVKSAVGGATTVTAATGGCNGVNYCVLAEYSGQNTSTTFDVFSASAPVATGINPLTTLAATTTGTNELMFSIAWADASGAITSQTGTSRYAGGANPYLYAQDANIPTSTVYISTWNQTSPFDWMAAQAAFNHQ